MNNFDIEAEISKRNLENLGYALTHADPEVRARAALYSPTKPDAAQIERGLRDKSAEVRSAFLNRSDLTFTCYQLLEAYRNGDFNNGNGSVNTRQQLDATKSHRLGMCSTSPKRAAKKQYTFAFQINHKEITTKEETAA